MVIGCIGGLGGAVLVAAAQEPAQSLPTLDASSFQQWLDYVRPTPSERTWEAIPWRPKLWTALVEAQAADKPVLVWAMNGHPMACT
jgi:hypothetical protein